MFAWTDDHHDELRRLAKDRLSSTQIAASFNEKYGANVTRNAILGKMTRLGIPLQGARLILRPRAVHLQPAPKPAPVPELVPVPPPIPAAPAPDPIPAPRVRFRDRKEHHECAWPFGDSKDPDMMCCGAPIVPNCPYCLAHCWLSYTSVSDHRDAKAARERAQRERLAA